MADIVTEWALDASRFQAGVRRAESEARRASGGVTGVLSRQSVDAVSRLGRMAGGFIGVSAAVRGASAAVREYNEAFPELTRGIDAVSEAQSRLSQSIVRELAPSLNVIGEFAARRIDDIGSLFDSITTELAVLAGGDREAIAARQQEAVANEQAIANRAANREAAERRRAEREQAFQEAAAREQRSQQAFQEAARVRAQEDERRRRDAQDAARGDRNIRSLRARLTELSQPTDSAGFQGRASADAFGLSTLPVVSQSSLNRAERDELLRELNEATQEQTEILRRIQQTGGGLAP